MERPGGGAAGPPADNAPGEGVDDKSHVNEAAPGGGYCVITAVTRLSAGLVEGTPLVPPQGWGDTTLTLPGGEWVDALNGVAFTAQEIPAATLFASLPVCLLRMPPASLGKPEGVSVF